MKYLLSFYILSSCLFFGCKGSNQNNSTQTSIKIERFDRDFYRFLTQTTDSNKAVISQTYPNLLSILGLMTVSNSKIKDPQFFPSLKAYFSNKTLDQIYRDELKTFENMEPYEEELSSANAWFSQKMNGKQLPRLSIHVSGFKQNTWVLENQISISGDKYLGVDYPAYKQFFEDYQRIQMQPKMIPRDLIRAFVLSELPKQKSKKVNLLSEMIKEGKVLFVLAAVLPKWYDYDLIGYTPNQLDWCKKNEKNTWQIIVEQQHLYSEDPLLIGKYMDDSPHTTPISPQSPGRLGAWMGWQIVKAYMYRTRRSLPDLLTTDAQTIIKGAFYDPK